MANTSWLANGLDMANGKAIDMANGKAIDMANGKWRSHIEVIAICHLPFAISVPKSTRTCAQWDEYTCAEAVTEGHFELLK
jgi:hypothetical protein